MDTLFREVEMDIAIGSDHAGFNLKQSIISLLTELGHNYEDFGCYDQGCVDYPDIGRAVAEAVAQERFQHGILICSTGIGMSMMANKVRGVRAALCHDTFTARRAREHNDANVLCLGESVVGQGLAREIVITYFDSQFLGGRHTRRLEKMQSVEE